MSTGAGDTRDSTEQDRWVLAAIVESCDDGVISQNQDGVITTWNRGAERIFGYTANAALGQPATMLLPPDRRAEEDLLQDWVRSGQLVRSFETVRLRNDGTSVPVSLTVSPLRDAAGVPVGTSQVVRDITERKRAQDALARSEVHAREIADAVPALVSYINAELRYEFVNREYELWFQQSRDSVVGKHMAEVLGEPAFTALRPHIETVLNGGDAHFETEALYLDGARRWIEAHYLPRRNGERVVGFFAMVLDITKRKRAEDELRQGEQRYRELAEALREREQRLRATFDKAAVGIIEVDTRDRITAVNDRVCQILGYARGELMGKTIHELTAPEDRSATDKINASLHQGLAETLSYEKRYLKRDGSRLWVHVAVSAVRDEQGKSLRHIGTVEDITDRKRAEQALRDSEFRHRTLTEAMPHLVWISDADGMTQYLNRKWTDYTGLSLEESIGGGWTAAVHPEDRPGVEAAWQESILRQIEFNHDYRLRSKGGVYRWFKSWGVPMRNAAGAMINWFGACTDIDDVLKAREILADSRDLLERTVQERTAKLQETVEELETFSYSIAHDMRSPLRAMQGFADAVLEDYGERVGPEGQDYLRRIKAAAARQDHFIRDVLNYSRLVRQELQLEAVDMDYLVGGVLAEYPALRAARENITVESPLGSMLGHAPSLVQSVSNLIGNALKFVPAGRPPQVRIRSELRGDKRRLYVEDNGLGIALEHQTRIFRLFERLHGQAEYPGTGIGLAVVRKAVERMGGAVGVESALGEGSRFWIELPIRS